MRQNKRPQSFGQLLGYLILSLVINALGNVLTIISSQKISPHFLGSAYWTAAETGLNNSLGGNTATLGYTFFFVGVLTAVINVILQKAFHWRSFFGNLLFMVPFSFFISFFANVCDKIFPSVTGWPVAFYVILNFIGVALIAIAISIYQRVHWVLHPSDDLMHILRFRYCAGNAAHAMWLSYALPTVLALIAIILHPSFSDYGIGTIFAFVCQGSITGWGDRHVFPSLKH